MNKRIKQIREVLCNSSNEEFAKRVGETQQTVSNWVGNRNLGKGVIDKILDKFPEVNPAWLLTGEGVMLKNKNIGHTIHGDNGSIKGNIKVIEQLEQASVIISQLEQRLKDKETIIELLKKQINILENGK